MQGAFINNAVLNECMYHASVNNESKWPNEDVAFCGIWYFIHLYFVPWSGSLIFVQKTQPYFWPVPYYQHWTWNMDTNVPTRPSCVSSVHGDIFSAVTAARRNHLNIWTLLVTAMAMNATIKYKYPIKVTRRIKMYPAVCLEEIITLVTAWLVATASNAGSRRLKRAPTRAFSWLKVPTK